MQQEQMDWDLLQSEMNSEYGGVNSAYLGNVEAQGTFLADVLGGTVASVADLGATVFNSLVPESYEVTTRDLLSRLNDNALRVYQENPETIHTASFIGGVFLPAGLAIKGMNLLRNGSKAVTMFSNERRAADIAKLEELARKGSSAQKELNALTRSVYGRQAAYDVTEAAAAEVAIIAAMNDHPFMEDYLDDPLKNFAIGLGIGGVIGSGLGHVVTRGAVRPAIGQARAAEISNVFSQMRPVPEGVASIDALQVQQANVRVLEGMVSGDNALPDGFGKEFATHILQQTKADQVDTMKGIYKSLGIEDDLAAQQAWAAVLSEDARFQNIDKIKPAKTKSALREDGSEKLLQEPGPAFVKGLNKKGQEVEEATTKVFIREANAFGDINDLTKYGRANSIQGVSLASIEQAAKAKASSRLEPDASAGMVLMEEASGLVDKRFAEAVLRVDSMSPEQFKISAIAPDDLPTAQAILARIQRESVHNPEAFKDFKLKTAKKVATYDDEPALKASGVGPDYVKRMRDTFGPENLKKYDAFGEVSGNAHDLLRGWRAGHGPTIRQIRSAADTYLGGWGAKDLNSMEERLVRNYDEIYNSARSKQLREDMKAFADKDDYVYLYRGMHGDFVGHQALSSYTTYSSKADEFGNVRLYKVRRENIIAAINDPTGGMKETELIVRAGAGESVSPLTALSKKTTLRTGELTATDLASRVMRMKDDAIFNMMDKGMDPLEIAIRTNTPVETIREYMTGDFASLAAAGQASDKGVFSYASSESIKAALAPTNTPIQVSSNLQKKLWSSYSASIDVKDSHAINSQILRATMAGAKDSIGRGLNDLLMSDETQRTLDIVRSQLALADQYLAGGRFVLSADQYMRHMKDLGRFASYSGQQLSQLSMRVTKEYFENIKGDIDTVAKSVVARSELNNALQVSTMFDDWHIYKDRKFWKKVKEKDENGKTVTKLEPLTYEGRAFSVQDDSVDAILQRVQTIGRDLYGHRALRNKMLGQAPITDRGFWFPSHNPRDKFIAYIHDTTTNQTKLITHSDEQTWLRNIELAKTANAERIGSGEIMIFKKGEQEYINKVAGREDPLFMTQADVGMAHGGSSARYIPSHEADRLAELIEGVEHSVRFNTIQTAEVLLSDISQGLQKIAKVTDQNTANQPFSLVKRATTYKDNPAARVRETMLDLKSLPAYETWQKANEGFEGIVGYALDKISRGFDSVYKPVRRLFGKSRGDKVLDYNEYVDMMKKTGALNAYEGFGDTAAEIFAQSNKAIPSDQVRRLVAMSNSFASTAALRFGDLAQPIVNAMSLPILQMAEIAAKQPETFLGHKIAKQNKIVPSAIMYDGAAAMNSPAFKSLSDKWAARGYYDSLVSEATEVLSLPRNLQGGAITAVEKALEGRIVKTMAWTADTAEQLVRKHSMHTGAVLAKRLYPDLGEDGITLFAHQFMNRVVGNYHAPQRPVFFQGTMGTALGLFQTYMLTFAQSMYRNLEMGNYKALGKTMLAQATVFGAGSLPGFGPVSDLIGEHYSKTHTDLQTGTIRAVSDPLAKAILYGVPSSLGPAFYTRGELAPRISTPANLEALPSVNMMMQAGNAVIDVATAMPKGGHAMMQALALQSVSRPLARGAELLTGYSTTQQGATVSTPEEVWTATGIMARVLGTRPTQEALARETNHLQRYYDSVDREERQKVVNQIRTAIRKGDIANVDLEKLALDYMDNGGSPTGWRSAVRTAILTTNMPLTGQLQDKLSPSNSLNHMIDMLDD